MLMTLHIGPPKGENAKGQSEIILLSIPFSINIDALLFTG
jgi:hypothetical protein